MSTEDEDYIALTFADAPSIVRAHQKDSYFESVAKLKLQDVLQLFKGQRFINSYPEEITIAAKMLYLCLTTLMGSKTLGEEYVDLLYVNRNAKRLPAMAQRLGFILSYVFIPYLISKVLKVLVPKPEAAEDHASAQRVSPVHRWLSSLSYTKILDVLMNLHVAIFYLQGSFYQISKRVFGLRYVFGHPVKQSGKNGSYEVLGFLVIVQYISKAINKLNQLSFEAEEAENFAQKGSDSADGDDYVYGARDLKGIENEIDLADPSILPYIPESSRKCILCLEYMKAPSVPPCGHCFCWKCIIEWSQERPECALCRQAFAQQELVCLR